MTFFHKIKRISQFLNNQLVALNRWGSPCIVSAYLGEFQPLFLNKLVQKIEKAMKRGCRVQVLLMMPEKVFSSHSLENQILLEKLKVRLM